MQMCTGCSLKMEVKEQWKMFNEKQSGTELTSTQLARICKATIWYFQAALPPFPSHVKWLTPMFFVPPKVRNVIHRLQTERPTIIMNWWVSVFHLCQWHLSPTFSCTHLYRAICLKTSLVDRQNIALYQYQEWIFHDACYGQNLNILIKGKFLMALIVY